MEHLELHSTSTDELRQKLSVDADDQQKVEEFLREQHLERKKQRKGSKAEIEGEKEGEEKKKEKEKESGEKRGRKDAKEEREGKPSIKRRMTFIGKTCLVWGREDFRHDSIIIGVLFFRSATGKRESERNSKGETPHL
eukprot:TRINITY_DN4293_c0_g6_i1.p1 TRINITY_DN4293_c0_g6~~TRINITY_DN4293_c0_g6_i1.p1  ORF type:complete len:138 (-),score=47.20 TRINITY_DN4293_c0_g6_i1:380-793(-)